MDLNKTFKTDETLENEGKWVEIGEGCSLLIGRLGSDKYNKAFNDLSAPVRTQIRNNTLSESQAESLLVGSLARGVLLGWEGVFIDDVELGYSEKNAIKILSEYKDFRKQVTDLASDMDQFRFEEIEEAGENLDEPSNGE